MAKTNNDKQKDLWRSRSTQENKSSRFFMTMSFFSFSEFSWEKKLVGRSSSLKRKKEIYRARVSCSSSSSAFFVLNPWLSVIRSDSGFGRPDQPAPSRRYFSLLRYSQLLIKSVTFDVRNEKGQKRRKIPVLGFKCYLTMDAKPKEEELIRIKFASEAEKFDIWIWNIETKDKKLNARNPNAFISVKHFRLLETRRSTENPFCDRINRSKRFHKEFRCHFLIFITWIIAGIREKRVRGCLMGEDGQASSRQTNERAREREREELVEREDSLTHLIMFSGSQSVSQSVSHSLACGGACASEWVQPGYVMLCARRPRIRASSRDPTASSPAKRRPASFASCAPRRSFSHSLTHSLTHSICASSFKTLSLSLCSSRRLTSTCGSWSSEARESASHRTPFIHSPEASKREPRGLRHPTSVVQPAPAFGPQNWVTDWGREGLLRRSEQSVGIKSSFERETEKKVRQDEKKKKTTLLLAAAAASTRRHDFDLHQRNCGHLKVTFVRSFVRSEKKFSRVSSWGRPAEDEMKNLLFLLPSSSDVLHPVS